MEKETNYNRFKFLKFNREISQAHVDKIKASIKENGYIYSFPILVDDEFNILDGQHRFIACKQMNLPIYYELLHSKNNKLIISINDSHKNWGCSDYIKFYAEKEQNQNYKNLRSIAKILGVSESAVWRLAGHSVGGCAFSQYIVNGTLKFSDEDSNKAYYNMQFIAEILKNIRMKPCNRIINAILELDKIQNYRRKRLVEQTKNYSTKAYKCQTCDDYKKMFIDIYNYNLKNKKNIIKTEA